jgi:rhodanese-related sulfurtransferase
MKKHRIIIAVQSKQIALFLLFCFLFTVFFRVEFSRANDKERSEDKLSIARGYCGVACLYSLIKLTDPGFELRVLVKPEYIGSRQGSSIAELKKAAEDNGLYVVPVGRLTSRVLRSCPHPVILHVKSSLDSEEYDHYKLFLGTENGKAKIFNPPEPVKLVAFAELAPRWDGNGLIVSAEPIDLASIFAPARERFVIYAAIAIAIILFLHWARRWLPRELLNSRRKLFGLSITQAAGFAIAALLCGMFYHFANDEGLLANANATASIQQAHQGNFILKISESEVQKLLNTDTVFIDARFARDFKSGHLEGAISLPVDANDVERQKVTADIAKDARIVLYCQSAGCKFAEIVAIRLIANGFTDISIFKGGWREWVAKNGKQKEMQL